MKGLIRIIMTLVVIIASIYLIYVLPKWITLAFLGISLMAIGWELYSI
ncbi:hypothetical protein [Thermohalobacter berrensis]|nr:hypothetical protein [Thermohalobacter berrensis]